MKGNKRTLCLLLFFSVFYLHNAMARVFIVGISEPYSPFVMKTATQSIYGFDISVMDNICNYLDIRCEYRQMPFKALIPSIMSEEIDFAISAIEITEDRLKKVHFSKAYIHTSGRFVSIKTYETITHKTLENKRIGLTVGTMFLNYLKHLKLKKAQIVSFENEYNLVEALMNGKIDFFITDNQSALWWAVKTDNILKPAGKPFKIGQGLGIVISKKNLAYLPKVNSAIDDLKEYSLFKTLVKRYFLSQKLIFR